MMTVQQVEEKYRRQDEARAACDSANRLAAMLGDKFMQGCAAALSTLTHKVSIPVVLEELYGWMKASGLTPNYTRELCAECLPIQITHPQPEGVSGLYEPAVEVPAEGCTNIICSTRRRRRAS